MPEAFKKITILWGFSMGVGSFPNSKTKMTPLQNKLNMKYIGTKSIDMNDIKLYFAMFSTTNDKIICLIAPHKMKMSHYSSALDTLWNI